MGKEHVIIEWLKPESDGGSELKNYIVDKREKSSTRWGQQHHWSEEHIFSVFNHHCDSCVLLLGIVFSGVPGGHGLTRPTPSMTPV